MSLYYKQKLISGVRDVPSMTLAQYNALTNKPKLWIRTDAPSGDRGINADDIQYDSDNSVKDKIDDMADYSETEKVIGTWIDGKPLYQKTVSFGALPNATSKSVAHNIANLKKIVNILGYATDGTNFISLPYIYQSSGNAVGVQIYANGTNIVVRTMLNDSSFTECYVTLKYTKTTD